MSYSVNSAPRRSNARKYPKTLNRAPVRATRKEKYHGHGTTREKGCGASMRELKSRSK